MPINPVKVSKALSDKNRVKILQMLGDTSRNVSDVAERLNVEENLASHHLRVLSALGFLKSKKKGREVYYDINKARMVSLLKTLSRNEAFREILQEALKE
jgi:DNA-binding transcriptional ArsR family regulator